MQLTRFRPVRRRAGGVRFTRLRRKAKHHLFSAISLPKALLPPDSIVLLQLRQKRWHLMNNLPDLKSEVRWFYECSCHFGQCTPRALPTAMLKPRLRGAARRAHGSSAEHAMRDLIASNAPLRNGSHKARQAYTKPLTPGDSRGSQSPWHAFLLYLSPCSERWSPRRA